MVTPYRTLELSRGSDTILAFSCATLGQPWYSEIMDNDTCRCGHPTGSTAPHPCHMDGYTCRKPATQRFYNPTPSALAGMQMKLAVSETWACDRCWEGFKALLKAVSP